MCVFIIDTAKEKGFVILTILFLTRIATVDMVLWDDTRVVQCSCDSMLYMDNTLNTVHMD